MYVPMCLMWQTGGILSGSGSRTSVETQISAADVWASPSTLKRESLHSVPLFSDTSECLIDSLLLLHTQPDFIQLLWNIIIGVSIQLTLHWVCVCSNPSPERS